MTSYVSSPLTKQPQQHLLSSPEAEKLATDDNDVTFSEVNYEDNLKTQEDQKPNKAFLEFGDFNQVIPQIENKTADEEDRIKRNHQGPYSLKGACVVYAENTSNLDRVEPVDSTTPCTNVSKDIHETKTLALPRSGLRPHVSSQDGEVCNDDECLTSTGQCSSGQTATETVDSSVDLQSKSTDIEVKHLYSRFTMARLRDSPWKFLLDPLAWSVLIYLGPAVSGLFSPYLLVMDIAANKGFHEHGLLLLMVIVFSSLVGKALAGVFSLCRKLPSFVLLAAAGLLGSGAILLLGSVSSLAASVVSISGLGLCLGMTVSVFPKCVLDMSSVGMESYPLALGLGNTMEGICNCLVPIVVGTYN